MKLYKFILVFVLMGSLISCNDFLDEPASKSTAVIPETLEHIEGLLNNYRAFISEPSNELIFGTDDYGFVTGLYDAANTTYGTTEVVYGMWDINIIPTITGRIYWPVEWRKIFTANLILNTLGGVEASAEEKANIEAECYFIRAYSYLRLATVYCLPYADANLDELGLPIKQTTSFEESVARASLGETYAFIEDNLMKAMEITRSFSQVNGLNESWRANTAAVNAFAARFYLSLNDYATAQTFAQDALNEYSQLRNYNTDMRYSDLPAEYTIFDPNPTQVTLQFPYTHDQQTVYEDRLQFGEAYYYRQLENAGWKYWPSQELLDTYDQTYDLRYRYHMVENYSYDRSATNPPYSYPGYIFFFKSDIPTGPSVPEMLLTKAECQVRQGDFAGGIATVNQLRVARMDATAPANVINLSATSQQDALTKVLDERRREMPFAHRWFDIRRYNNNGDSSDDVTISRTFYPFNANTILGNDPPMTYTLEVNSRRYAYPIPTTDIIASEGQIEQNQY